MTENGTAHEAATRTLPRADEAPEWPMTPQEARDLTIAQANLQAVQAQFNAIADRFTARAGLAQGSYRFDIQRCVWLEGAKGAGG